MKLRLKLLISFIAVPVVLVALTALFNHTLLRRRLEQEKIALYTELTQQALTTFEFLSDDIEYTVFDSVLGAKIPEMLLSDQARGITQVQVEAQLRIICSNSSYIDSILLTGVDGNMCYASLGELGSQPPERIRALSEAGALDAKRDTYWMSDGEGNLYLRQSVYRIFPHTYAGMLIVAIDTDYLRSVIGLSGVLQDVVCLLDYRGEPVLYGNPAFESAFSAYFASLESVSAAVMETGQEYRYDSESYYMISQFTRRSDWGIVSMVPQAELRDIYDQLNQITLISGIFAALFATGLSLVFSRALIRGINRLLASMAAVSAGELDIQIPVESKDEIGLLAENFNWMLRQLQEITSKMIAEATEKQNAEYELLEIKYRSLQAQVSPHFICNILSSINAFSAMGESAMAGKLSVLASRYLRDNLEVSDRKYTSVADEIRMVNEYVRLYRAVFAIKFRFVVKLAPETRSARIPNLILQPLVENALIHGLKNSSQRNYRISISAFAEGGRLRLHVSDNGSGFDPRVIEELSRLDLHGDTGPKYAGFGTRSVVQRLKLLYAENHSFCVERLKEGGSLIIIDLPLETYYKESNYEQPATNA